MKYKQIGTEDAVHTTPKGKKYKVTVRRMALIDQNKYTAEKLREIRKTHR